MVVMAATEREDKLSHGQLTQQDNRMSTLSVQLSVKCPSSWAFFHKDMPRSGVSSISTKLAAHMSCYCHLTYDKLCSFLRTQPNSHSTIQQPVWCNLYD